MPPSHGQKAARTAVLQLSGDEAPKPFGDWSEQFAWREKPPESMAEFIRQALTDFGNPSTKNHIRPTERSTFWERWRYFRKARRICRLAASDIAASKRYAPGEVFQIALIDGCFKRRPPQPHVTLSEVIAVLFDSNAVEHWDKQGILEEKLEFVTKIIRKRSLAVWKKTGFRTYVLSYIAGDIIEPNRRRMPNKILAISLDEFTKPEDPSGEEREREKLLTDLKVKFGDDLTKQALVLAQANRPRPALDRESFHLISSEKSRIRIVKPEIIATVVAGISLTAVLVGSFIGIIWLVIKDQQTDGGIQAVIGLVGMISAYGLMIVGDMAAEILRRSKV